MPETITFPSGFKRSSSAGRINYLLVRDGVMYERWAQHLSAGCDMGGARNWLQAGTHPDSAEEELERFRESFLRHAEAWLRGEEDEDHAAAMFFNVDGAERVKMLMREREREEEREFPRGFYWLCPHRCGGCRSGVAPCDEGEKAPL